MVQLAGVLEVCPVNRKLVVSFELAAVAVLRRPGIISLAHGNKHAVVYGGAVVFTPHFRLWGWRIEVGVRGEDYPPGIVDLMDFWGPEVGGIGLVGRRLEDGLGLCG